MINNKIKLKRNVFKNILKDIQELSSCYKYKVSAIIVKNWKIISYWYNWNAPWLPECKEYYNFLVELFDDIKNNDNYIYRELPITNEIDTLVPETKKKELKKEILNNKKELLSDDYEIKKFFIKKLEDYFYKIWRWKYIIDKEWNCTEIFNYLIEKIWEYKFDNIKKIIKWKKTLIELINEFNFLHSDLSTFWEIHAEQNALLFAAKEWISVNWADIYVNYLPCIHCAKLISVSWIKNVYYVEDYVTRWMIENTEKFLKACWIKVKKI